MAKKPKSPAAPIPQPEPPATPRGGTPSGNTPARGKYPLDPSTVRRICNTISIKILRKFSDNKAAIKDCAQQISQAIAAQHVDYVRRHLSASPEDVIPWDAIVYAHYNGPGRKPSPIVYQSCTLSPIPHSTIQSTGTISNPQPGQRDGTSVPPGQDIPTNPVGNSRRGAVDTLLRRLLASASDGEISPSDQLRLAEQIAKLDGLYESQAQDIVVQIVMFDADSYRRAMGK